MSRAVRASVFWVNTNAEDGASLIRGLWFLGEYSRMLKIRVTFDIFLTLYSIVFVL